MLDSNVLSPEMALRQITQEIVNARNHHTEGSLFERVLVLSKSCPGNVAPSNSALKHTPLHIICMKESPEQLQVIKLLSEKFPHFLRTIDRFGLLPLHYACKGLIAEECIRYLTSRFPESLKRKDSRGRLPLHHALDANQGATLSLVTHLVEAYHDSIDESIEWKGNALHIACKGNASFEIIKFLVDKNSSSVHAESGDHGRLPIHNACIARAPISVVKYLHDCYPDSLRHKDQHGLVPLQYACSVENPCVEVIQFFLTVSYSSFLEIHGGGWLHAVCDDPMVCNSAVIRAVASFYSEEIMLTDNKGTLPIHRACQTADDLASIGALLEEYPESLERADFEGSLPLHWACRNRKSTLLVAELLHHHPAAVECIDNRGQLPVHEAILNRVACLNTLFSLLVEYPSSCQ